MKGLLFFLVKYKRLLNNLKNVDVFLFIVGDMWMICVLFVNDMCVICVLENYGVYFSMEERLF